MGCTIILLAYLLVKVIPIFGEFIYMSNSDCDTEYDMDTYKTVTLEYHGSDILYSNPCSVKFTKSSFDYNFCISAQQVTLDCKTQLEYHEYFVKSYTDPEKRIFCTNTTVDEWCPNNKYLSKIFIVIRKPSRESSDYVKLLVHLKNVSDDYSFSSISSLAIWLTVIALIVLSVAVTLKIKRRMAAAQRPQALYQTTTAAVNMQTGDQVPPQGYSQVPQSTPPFTQGNYHVHLMQSAYPMTNTQCSEQQGFNNHPCPSAPPPDYSAAPPPSDGSVGGKTS